MLLIVCCMWFVVCAVYCLLVVVCWLLFVGYVSLFAAAVCCSVVLDGLMFMVRCLLFVVCGWFLVV